MPFLIDGQHIVAWGVDAVVLYADCAARVDLANGAWPK
jgi:hypothetical protein